jgi:formylglycine-generating enzyme required for sulfatase activity
MAGGYDKHWNSPQTVDASQSGYLYLRVRVYNSNNSNAGTFGIVYSTNNNRPITGGGFIPTGPVEMAMVGIKGGTFTMGSPTNEPGRESDPGIELQHQVTLTGFYMGKYEVTQAQYEAVTGTNPSYYTTRIPPETSTANRPVEWVSWFDAIRFCNKLSVANGLTPAYRINGSTDPDAWGDTIATLNTVEVIAGSTGYRLPTEAQWEYACRAGTTTAYNWGTNTINSSQANYGWDKTAALLGNTRTYEVGTYAPNAWGLYDMHGNVWEWCWDRLWDYPSGAQTDPTGPASTTLNYRVIRGGAHSVDDYYARSAQRMLPGSNASRNGSLGFRVALPDDGKIPGGGNLFPIVGDFTYENLSQELGSVIAVTITAKEGKTSGTVSNIRYAGSTTVPQTVGTYAVTFDVAAAAGWNAVTLRTLLTVKPVGSSRETAITLTENQWANGALTPESGVAWYKFNVISGTRYYVWWNDSYDGPTPKDKTLDVLVRADNGSVWIFGNNNSAIDNGWTTPQSFTVSQAGTVYLAVYPYNSSDIGTFGIVFSTGSTRP